MIEIEIFRQVTTPQEGWSYTRCPWIVSTASSDTQLAWCTTITEGHAALELHATRKDGNPKRVARVVFWDAYGDFFFETFNADVPVVVAEQLIAEAKDAIKIR